MSFDNIIRVIEMLRDDDLDNAVKVVTVIELLIEDVDYDIETSEDISAII